MRSLAADKSIFLVVFNQIETHHKMKPEQHHSIEEVVKTISQDRERTNILRTAEQKAIAFLVSRIPAWVTPDMLTLIGFSGNALVFAAFLLAGYHDASFLLLGVPGLLISWIGDSLDGRLAYFRHKPHKWYGFTLDLTVDWVGIVLIGTGYILYTGNPAGILGYLFVGLYGWEIITTLMRYRITGKYSIDSGIFGPTEVRILVSCILILEVLLKDSLIVISAIACTALLVTNIRDFLMLLKIANEKDRDELAQTGP
jgi:phosphatidylglycerophosphate synthase